MKLALFLIQLIIAGIPAGETFLEQIQKRDSVLVGDKLRYGMVFKNIEEGTPIGLPELKIEAEGGETPLEILSRWQMDSTRISGKKERPARYDIKASIEIMPFWGGEYELPQIPAIVGKDTLVFSPQKLVVTEPSIDMESFEPSDIKPQIKFPYTFSEILPGILIVLGICGIFTLLVLWARHSSKAAQEKKESEPAHLRALRKLDQFRSDKYWKKENQKTFYCGVTDTLREYIAARYGIGAKEMTTAEIFSALDTNTLKEPHFSSMKELFERADFVKFAKFTASDEENAGVIPSAVRFVTETSLVAEDKEEEE